MDVVNVVPTPEDDRWAITAAMRLLSKSREGASLYGEQVTALTSELVNADVERQIARTWTLLALLGTTASKLLVMLEQELGIERQELLAQLERGLEEDAGLR